MTNLQKLAAQLESKTANDAWAAHKADFAAHEAAQEAAAYEAEMAEERKLGIGPSEVGGTVPDTMAPKVPDTVITTADRLREVLMDGGYATVSVKNTVTNKHVTIQVVGRKRKPGGKGWVSRQTKLGRVGLSAADCLEVRDPDRDYPVNYVGRWYKDGGWAAGKDADPIRAKVAEVVLSWALAGTDMWDAAEVRLSTRCKSCGRKLTHPDSIDDLMGEECKGHANSSQPAPHLAHA